MSPQMSNIREKEKHLPHKGLGGLLELPTPRPTTPRVLAKLERAKRRPRKAMGGVEKKGGKGTSESRDKGVKCPIYRKKI